MDAEIRLKAIGHRIAKDTKECIRSFFLWRGKCEHRSEPTDTETGGCKHKKAYAKHPNLALAWCDYNVCPIIAAGMKEH